MTDTPTHARVSCAGGYVSFQEWYYNAAGERVYLRNGTSSEEEEYWPRFHAYKSGGITVQAVHPPDDIPF